jgi:uncharacterized membrane protein YhaH (DUF805 family)
MNFPDAVKSVLTKYATFSGRAPRSEYWFWILFTFIAGIVLAIIDSAVFGADAAVLGSIFKLATLVPGIAVAARRLHDVNRSGWWMLIAFTIIGIIPLIIWNCSKGTAGENRFGSDPLPAA